MGSGGGGGWGKPYPTFGATATVVTPDWQSLITTLGGNAAVPAFYDARSNVTGTSPVTAWNDVRGSSGFGPTLTNTGSPTLTGGLITTNGTSSALQSSAFSGFDLSTAISFVVVRAMAKPASVGNNFSGAIAAAANAKYLGICPAQSGGSPAASIGVDTTYWNPGPTIKTWSTGPSLGVLDGRLMVEVFANSGTLLSHQMPPGPLETYGSPVSAAASGSNILSLGCDFTKAVFGRIQAAAVIVLNSVVSQANANAIAEWAVGAYGANCDAGNLVVTDGDSLVAGCGPSETASAPFTSDFTLGWVPQMFATSPFTSGWAYANLGTPSISLNTTSTGLRDRAAAAVDTILPLRTRTKNILCIWGGTNDMALLSRTAAQTFADLTTYCAARHTAGWKVVVATCLSRGDINIDAARATYNTSIRNAIGVTAGFDALADIAGDATIGPNGSWSNTTYWATDTVHLNATGYGLAYPYFSTAIQSL